MGEALEEIEKDLDERYTIASELLRHARDALRVYQTRTATNQREIDIPRCSRRHLEWMVKELTEYTVELHHVRCELPRLLSNKNPSDD